MVAVNVYIEAGVPYPISICIVELTAQVECFTDVEHGIFDARRRGIGVVRVFERAHLLKRNGC